MFPQSGPLYISELYTVEEKMNNNLYKWIIFSLIIASLSFAGGYFYAKKGDTVKHSSEIITSPQEKTEDKEHQADDIVSKKAPLALSYFQFENARVIRNYHNRNNPHKCTSLEFKATIINLTESRKQIFTDFYIKDEMGYVLETVRTSYEIDGNSGTRKPMVLETFGRSSDDFSCEDVASIELRYWSYEDNREVSMDLPICDQ